MNILFRKKTKEGSAGKKNLEFFLLDTLTTTFLIELLTQKWTQDLFFQNQGTLCTQLYHFYFKQKFFFATLEIAIAD